MCCSNPPHRLRADVLRAVDDIPLPNERAALLSWLDVEQAIRVADDHVVLPRLTGLERRLHLRDANRANPWADHAGASSVAVCVRMAMGVTPSEA